MGTIPSKIKAYNMGHLKMRFTRLDKYFWSHSNRLSAILPKSKRVAEGMERIIRRANSRQTSECLSIPEENKAETKVEVSSGISIFESFLLVTGASFSVSLFDD